MNNFIQLIFCVETNKKARTDEKYLTSLINRFFTVGYNKISFVHMDGKHKYLTESVRKDIRTKDKKYKLTNNGESFVIYVFDKDNNTSDPTEAAFEDKIKKFCKNNNYQLIWFVSTIEEVLWGQKVEKKDKQKMADSFLKTQKVEEILKTNLEASANVNRKGKSNFLTVLNQFNLTMK